MAEEQKKPKTEMVRASDIVPYEFGIWCTVGDNPHPFVNEIVSSGWTEDGKQISAMLESFNFDFWDPDEMVEVVRVKPPDAGRINRHMERMSKRPSELNCPTCGHALSKPLPPSITDVLDGD